MNYPEMPQIRHASREMVRHLGLVQGTCNGISMSHAHTLIELGSADVSTAAELAENLNLDKSSTSRILTSLVQMGLVMRVADGDDKRRRPVRLTEIGRARLAEIDAAADAPVAEALALLRPEQRETVLEGLSLYARALKKAKLQKGVVLREIEPQDDPAIAALIRETLAEFGAVGPGYASQDAEVDAMCAHYRAPGRVYYTLVRDGRVLGGGGIAPLDGGDGSVCELRKMYFRPELRGLGLGTLLIRRCLEAAKTAGYRGIYLETLTHMDRAQRLYRSHGFQPVTEPMGDTGHCRCDRWFYRDL